MLNIFLEGLLIQSVAFTFRVLILYASQSRFVFINKIHFHFLELKTCLKYLTESFFAETFRD